MINLSSNKLFVTYSALEFLQSSKHFPEDLSPWNLLLSEEQHKLVDIPMLITLMLANHVAMEVNKQVGFGALHPFSLVGCIERPAVDAPMQLVVIFFE